MADAQTVQVLRSLATKLKSGCVEPNLKVYLAEERTRWRTNNQNLLPLVLIASSTTAEVFVNSPGFTPNQEEVRAIVKGFRAVANLIGPGAVGGREGYYIPRDGGSGLICYETNQLVLLAIHTIPVTSIQASNVLGNLAGMLEVNNF